MKSKSILLTLILSFCFVPWCMAQTGGAKFFENFKSIPVLQEGRIKPLDTFARDLLLQFSGKDYYGNSSAARWLAKLLFTPLNAVHDKVFLINDPEIAVALDIKPERSRLYSFAELKDAFPKLEQLKEAAGNIDERQRSLVENEIIRVANNAELYIDFSEEFLWVYPDADFTVTSQEIKRQLGLPPQQNQFSFYDVALKAGKIRALIMDLKDKNPAQISASQQELMVVVNNMLRWTKNYQNLPFLVVPAAGSNDWLSPWDAIAQNFSDGQTRKLIGLWYRMAAAYNEGNFISFDMSAQAYGDAVKDGLDPHQAKIVGKFPLELIYNATMPFMWAKIFYILAFVFFVISFVSPRRFWYWLGLSSVIAGFIPHTFGLLMRIIIMARPPVTNLYETFIFVGFITVLLGLGIEYFNRQWLGIVTSAICGTILLFIAGRYSAEGDTLKMLVAVLNSNFWLATHVTTITMGYGATCVTGILGHIWLIQAALGRKQAVLDNTYKTTLGIMGVALTLTFLGTNLGGIWADQSWGRFWGWDPKENGALMIVLWLAILFHAKYAQMIGPLGLAVGSVIAMMVVMWAWFGVNLLSIGLHSYGFTSGIANALIAYAIFEIVFLLVLTPLALRRK
ncbi:MAG: cytochrome c biogenesis protein CcsA [Candidatus Omnitrophica bacterium]|nr:cytochrome c biogenesis protein CcsA [Candidatus Omnitrophota bacterium]MDE2230884.1 cytochrome c biogenesis protein CcsA [Candidatus Omnitrophota bacterium]